MATMRMRRTWTTTTTTTRIHTRKSKKRNLVREITPEINERQSKGEDVDDLRELLDKILAFHWENDTESEYEAVDLALELDDIGVIPGYLTSTNYTRIGLYLTRIGSLPAVCLPKEDCEEILDNLFSTYDSFPDAPRALQIALFLNNMEQVGSLFSFGHDLLRLKQLCYIIARQGITFVLDKKMIRNDEDRKALQEIINNTHLCEGYRTLAREVAGISSEDIYEAHLLPAGAGLESALQKLAATFANTFGNAGCG